MIEQVETLDSVLADQKLMLMDLADQARKDMLAFALYTKEDYEVGWHNEFLAEQLNDFVFNPETRFLMVFMPPRHGKSELVSRKLPAFIHGNFPNDEIMAASYNDDLAGDMCIATQNLIDSQLYKDVFPHVKILPPRTAYSNGTRNSVEHTLIGYKGKYRGQGVGGSFTGKGANWIIIDDPIKGREVADSEAFRERLWSFWRNDLYTRLERDLKSGRMGKVLITLTRWHEDDLAGRLLKLMKEKPETAIQWKIVEFPAIRFDMSNAHDPRQIGEALWPAKYPLEELQKIRENQGARAWGSLYQQNPRPEGGNIFKDTMFDLVDEPNEYDYSFMTADTAYKDKQVNDFNVFSHWGVLDNELYFRGYIRKHIKADEVEDWCTPWILNRQEYGFRQVWIEPKGHGIYLNGALRKKGVWIPSDFDLEKFYKDRNKDKVERANNVVPHLAHRKVHIVRHIGDKEELLNEATAFPNGKNDDWTDTLIDALKKVYGDKASIFESDLG